MTRALLVKMSSLGDVVHALPAVSAAAAHGVRFDWVVEEAFAPIARAHPAVENVIEIGWRRWRKGLFGARRELAAFKRKLRNQTYDVVLDAQGLIKSAVVTKLALGAQKIGFDRASAREGLAATAYDDQVRVARGQHAVSRLQQLFAQAFAYPEPAEDEFGLPEPTVRDRTCLFLHGTTWSSKLYPETLWQDLAEKAEGAGFEPHFVYGSEVERERALRLASNEAQLWPRLELAELKARVGQTGLVIGADSGLTHLAGALGGPTIGLYGATDPELTGVRGSVRAQPLRGLRLCAVLEARVQPGTGDDGRRFASPALLRDAASRSGLATRDGTRGCSSAFASLNTSRSAASSGTS